MLKGSGNTTTDGEMFDFLSDFQRGHNAGHDDRITY